jgi:hypothetical protein
MELLGDVGHVESHFILFGEVLVSVQDSCMVCAKCTIWLDIVLDEAQVEARFSLFGYSAKLDAR